MGISRPTHGKITWEADFPAPEDLFNKISDLEAEQKEESSSNGDPPPATAAKGKATAKE